MITCKLTGVRGKGIKSHIVPKAFYKITPQKKGVCKLYSNTPEQYPKKAPVGVYDPVILTREGEDKFADCDNYASDLLLREINGLDPIMRKRDLAGWQILNYDYKRLKLFALSVLWRAGVSTHPMYSRVKLGQHEEILRNMLITNNPGTPEQYSVTIFRWRDAQLDQCMLDPHREKLNHINCYRIYCGKYILSVKVDKRKGIPFPDLHLMPDKPLIIIARDLVGSDEYKIMQNTAKMHHK